MNIETLLASYIPEGWWLFDLAHEHTLIRRKGDTYTPKGWRVSLQSYPTGGKLTQGYGNTLEEAILNAVRKAENA